MQNLPIPRKPIRGPRCWVRAIVPHRVRIDAIDVDASEACAGSPVAVGFVVVVDQRNDDSGVAKLLLDECYVLAVELLGKLCRVFAWLGCVFVFGLDENYGAAVRDLSVCYDLTKGCEIQLRGI